MARVVVAMIMALFILGCGNDANEVAVNEGDTVTITYWPAANPSEVKLARQLAAQWEKLHPEVKIKVQPIPAGSSSEEVILAAIVAKTTPDICSNISPSIIRKLINSKGVLCIDDFDPERQVLRQRMSEQMIAGFVAPNGKLYQVPWKCNPAMLAYNVGWFRRVGIEPPSTYGEFAAIAQRLAEDTDGDGRFDRWPLYISINAKWWQRLFDFYTFYSAASQGQTLVKNEQVVFGEGKNREAAAAVFKFFQEQFAAGYFPKMQDAGNLFLEGKVAMEIVGPWKIAEYEQFKPQGFEYDFAPIPRPDNVPAPSYTFGDPKNIAIFSTCKHPEAAWQFVQFLISKQADRQLLQICQQIPIRSNMAQDPEFTAIFDHHPQLKKFAIQAAYSTPLDDSPHLTEILDQISAQYEACAIYGLISPEQAVDNAARRAKVILNYW